MLIHILHQGYALCGGGPPNGWPLDFWISRADYQDTEIRNMIPEGDNICPKCEAFEKPISKDKLDFMRVDIKQAIDTYVSLHQQPGDFVTAVLMDKLADAVCRADADNLAHIKDIVLYVSNDIRGDCHGSPEIVINWLKDCGGERTDQLTCRCKACIEHHVKMNEP